jgi:hypothetical protein
LRYAALQPEALDPRADLSQKRRFGVLRHAPNGWPNPCSLWTTACFRR